MRPLPSPPQHGSGHCLPKEIKASNVHAEYFYLFFAFLFFYLKDVPTPSLPVKVCA